MRKLIMMLAFASVSATVMAQDEENFSVPVQKYSVATNSFWSNWFLQANVSGTAFYSDEEHQLDLSSSPFKGFRNNLGFSVALGKWFTPGLGLRTKFSGVSGRTVMGDDKDANTSKYWTLNEQVLFNLSNLFCGYNEQRVWNFIPYFGAGMARSMSYDTYAWGASFGLLNTFRVSDRVAFNVEFSYGLYDAVMDGVHNSDYEHCIKNTDQVLSLELGVTYNLGSKRWSKAADMDAIKELTQGQLDALNAQVADAQAENERLMQLLDEKEKAAPATTVETKVVAAPVSVFFNLGKWSLASRKDLQNVKELAEVAKDSNATLVVTGYADSKTGSADFNKELSRKRAETVAEELVKMGVGRDKIEVVAEGGVDTLSPYPYNRRATVSIK